jgi:hypothetical protein
MENPTEPALSPLQSSLPNGTEQMIFTLSMVILSFLEITHSDLYLISSCPHYECFLQM